MSEEYTKIKTVIIRTLTPKAYNSIKLGHEIEQLVSERYTDEQIQELMNHQYILIKKQLNDEEQYECGRLGDKEMVQKEKTIIKEEIIPDSKKLNVKKSTKKGLEYLDVVECTELDNSYKVENDDGEIAFIGKSLVDHIEDLRIHFTKQTQHWFTEDKIKWRPEDYNEDQEEI